MRRRRVAPALLASVLSACTLLAPPDEDLLPPSMQANGGTGAVETGGGDTGGSGTGGAPGGAGGTLGGTGGTGGGATGGTGGVVSLCDNERQDAGETGTDCGGNCPARCPAGGGCDTEDDCVAGLSCVGDICSTPECNDTVQNGLETGTDCGGPNCPDCPTGQGCSTGSDCESSVCGEDKRCAAPSCDDDTKNGDETGVDCGGGSLSGCMQCPVNQGCTGDTDCQTQTCAPNLNPPTGGCSEDATDCACTSCPVQIANCNPTGPQDAPQCAEVLTCLLNSNCSSFADCYDTNGSGACYDFIMARGGDTSPSVQRARDTFDNCIIQACPRTCQPFVE